MMAPHKLLLIVVLAYGAAACNSTPPPVPDASSGPPITYVTRDLDNQAWSPAHELPDAQRAQIEDFVIERDLRLLMPSPAPVADPTGASARLSTTTHQPSGETFVTVAVETPNEFLSLRAGQPSSVPGCRDRIRNDSIAGTGATWIPTEVRGHEGCAALAEQGLVSQLEWEEDHTTFSVEWTGFTAETVKEWLTTWTVLP